MHIYIAPGDATPAEITGFIDALMRQSVALNSAPISITLLPPGEDTFATDPRTPLNAHWSLTPPAGEGEVSHVIGCDCPDCVEWRAEQAAHLCDPLLERHPEGTVDCGCDACVTYRARLDAARCTCGSLRKGSARFGHHHLPWCTGNPLSPR